MKKTISEIKEVSNQVGWKWDWKKISAIVSVIIGLPVILSIVSTFLLNLSGLFQFPGTSSVFGGQKNTITFEQRINKVESNYNQLDKEVSYLREEGKQNKEQVTQKIGELNKNITKLNTSISELKGEMSAWRQFMASRRYDGGNQ